MVTSFEVLRVIRLVANIVSVRSYCYLRLESRARLKVWYVKGKSEDILAYLQRCRDDVDYLSKEYSKLGSIRDSINGWTTKLDQKYKVDSVNDDLLFLSDSDTEKLAQDTAKWLQTVIETFQEKDTMLRGENMETILPPEILSELDDETKSDLMDGVKAIMNKLPTPAVMILYRVSERIIRKYYENMTGEFPRKMHLHDIIETLEKSQQSDKSLLGYLDFFRSKRNEAQHPQERYTQRESERILLRIIDLLHEIQTKKP